MGRSVTTSIVTTVADRSGDVKLGVADVSGAAPLESPILTGVPTAPTAPAGTSTAQVATTEFVSKAAMSAGSVTLTSAAPLSESIGATSTLGNSSAAARSDHVHAMPGLATSTDDGFMSADDKAKLEGIAGGAEKNTVTSVAGKTGAVAVGWDDVQSKPSTYPPSAHAHDYAATNHTHDLTGASVNFANSAGEVAWEDVSGKPDTFTPSAHTHDLSGSSVKYADTAGRARPARSDGMPIDFNWTSKLGQPQWVWGTSDGADETNNYVFNPLNFSVNHATTANKLRPGPGEGINWDNDAFGGGGDTASITLESNKPDGTIGEREATRMRFKLTNDIEDKFEFTSRSTEGADYNDAMTMNGNVVLNGANYGKFSHTRLLRRDGNDPYYLEHKWSGTRWRLDGYDVNGDFHSNVEVGAADYAASAGTVAWSGVTGTPSTYPPAAHNHDYSSASVNYANSAGGVAWANVSGKPNTFPPDAHNHDYAATNHTHSGYASSDLVQKALGNLQGSKTLAGSAALTWADCGKLVLLGGSAPATVSLPGYFGVGGFDGTEDGKTFHLYNWSQQEYTLNCGDIWIHGAPYVWITHTETIKPGEYWTITAAGGNYIASVTYDGPSVGIRQTWQSFSGFERVNGVVYENTSGSPISVIITCPDSGGATPSVKVTVDSTVIVDYAYDYGGSFGQCSVSFVVPKGSKYKAELLNVSFSFSKWVELR